MCQQKTVARFILGTCVILVLLTPALCGCSQDVAQPVVEEPTMQPEQTYRDPAQPIEVLVGQAFSLTLESNPSTGYHWQLAQPVDETIVKKRGPVSAEVANEDTSRYL